MADFRHSSVKVNGIAPWSFTSSPHLVRTLKILYYIREFRSLKVTTMRAVPGTTWATVHVSIKFGMCGEFKEFEEV